MNWIKENKFLSGFLGVLTIGIGVLGYFVLDAMDRVDTARTNYTEKASDLARLQNLPLTPSKKNLDALVAQKTEAVNVIAEYQATLGAKSFPLEPMTPEQFQDQLKATKTAIFESAAAGGTKLPPKFFLGFEAYETTPPKPEAAAPLGRQLKAIEWVLNQVFENRILEIDDKEPMKRERLPEETGRKAAEPPKKGGGGAPKPLVVTHSFELKMKCRQQQLAGLLNVIVGPKAPQFYIPRLVQVTNERPGVSRVDPAKAADGKPGGYFLGNEHLVVTLLIEVVNFAEPAAGTKNPSAP